MIALIIRRLGHTIGRTLSEELLGNAGSVLSLEPEELRRPRSADGARAALRILLTARENMTNERTATVNALTALLRVAALGFDARKALTARQIVEVSRWRTRVEDLATATARTEAIRLAKRAVDKVGFARAVLYCLEHDADKDLRAITIHNFEQLFTRIDKAQRQAVRSNGRERVRRTLNRYKDSFLRDHPTSALRRDVEGLLEDIEHQLTEITDETERVRKDMRLIRKDFDLAAEPGAIVENYDEFKQRLGALPYGGVQAVQGS